MYVIPDTVDDIQLEIAWLHAYTDMHVQILIFGGKNCTSVTALPRARHRSFSVFSQSMAEKYQSKVKAIVRIRPCLGNEITSSCVQVTGPGQLELRNLKLNPPTEAISYKCDHYFFCFCVAL